MSPDTAAAAGMSRDELREHLRSTPTVSVEFAGACMGISRPAAYRAAERGEIRVLRLGRRLMVPTRWLEQVLMLDEDRHVSPVCGTGEPISHSRCAGISEACPHFAREKSAKGAA